jgi:hypothetical protein
MRERGTGPKLCRVRARFIPFALIVALMLAACDSGGSGGDPTASAPVTGSTVISHSVPPHPASPTVPADVPTTGPNLLKAGEQPPVMPLEASQHTPAGAIAFAKFFIQTIDWGFATTSGAYMRHYFLSSCIECASHADSLDKTRKAGEHYLGSRFAIRSISSVRSDRRDGSEASAKVLFDLTSMEVLNSSGAFVSGDIARPGNQRLLWMAWRANGWVVVDMSPAT